MITTLALLLASAVALADDSEFVEPVVPTAVEEPEKPEADLTAELGGALGNGNSEYWMLNTQTIGSYKWGKNQVGGNLGANVGATRADTDGNGLLDDTERQTRMAETARRVFGQLRYDRFLTDNDSLYLLGGGFSDRYSGFDYRLNVQLGYARLLVDDDKTKVRVEGGVDYAREDYIEGIDPNRDDIVAARVLVGLKHEFGENVSFSDEVEAYENVLAVKDLRVYNTAVLSVKLNSTFSLKLSHKLLFDNQPVTGFRPVDSTMLLTFVAALF